MKKLKKDYRKWYWKPMHWNIKTIWNWYIEWTRNKIRTFIRKANNVIKVHLCGQRQ